MYTNLIFFDDIQLVLLLQSFCLSFGRSSCPFLFICTCKWSITIKRVEKRIFYYKKENRV